MPHLQYTARLLTETYGLMATNPVIQGMHLRLPPVRTMHKGRKGGGGQKGYVPFFAITSFLDKLGYIFGIIK